MNETLLQQLFEANMPSPCAGREAPPVPPTLSADLRNSGYKIAPIDVNLFPAGWHNLCSGALPAAGTYLQEWATQRGYAGRRVLVLAEFMTRNAPYIENLLTIGRALEAGGFDVRFGVLSDEMDAAELVLEGLQGKTGLTMHKLHVMDGVLTTQAGFVPDWVLSNNDFTSGLPPELSGLTVPIVPSPELGWHVRKKSDFFHAYETVATRLAQQHGLDPWMLIPETVSIDDVDFWNQEGLEPVADAVDAMLVSIREAYAARGIHDTPFVVVKDEAGTFGMGVITLESSEQVRNPNRKLRQKMQTGKSGRPIRSVLVQEGIYTRDVIGDCVAEPVVMAAGGHMIGGFFRYHCSRDETENLNTKGMVFARLCNVASGAEPCPEGCIQDAERYRVYGWFAELCAVAAGFEIADASRA